MAPSLSRWKRFGVVLAVALLVVTAGCGGSPGGQTTTTDATNATTTTAQTSQTTTQATTQETTTQTTTTSGNDSESRTAEVSGKMAVVIDDERLDLSAVADTNQSSSLWFDDSGPGTQWQRTDEDVTLAEALGAVGVNVTENGVSYEGTTYSDGENNTSVAVRVNGDQVDADEYVLEQGDEVWAVAITHPLDQSVPGDHIDHDALHVHGYINMSVNGESVNFGQPKYKTPGHNQHFHFEGDTAPLWHAHSWSVTLEYAMNSLAGINVTEDSVTYDNTTYERSDSGTSLTIQVNNESVDPSTYVLKDGDKITIEVESNSSS